MKILKGEALLIKSNKDLEQRLEYIKKSFDLNEDIVLLNNKNIGIEDIRYFQDIFQKTSQESNKDFKKLGVIIFDDISQQAQNSLLKILEDIDKENCIILYTNKNIKLLSTILSRVIEEHEEESVSYKKAKIKEPDLTDKENPPDKQEVIKWIEYKISTSNKSKDKTPLIWINSPSPNIKYIVEYVNFFY